MELVLRFIFSIDKIQFLKDIMNWIDIVSIIPYFIFLMLHVEGHDEMGIFKTVKFVRIISLLRLTKHSKRLQMIGVILKFSLPYVQFQILCICMIIFVAGTFLHYAEHSSNHRFVSVLDGLWWATQTITTVGYGDIIPHSLFGKLFAGFFMLFAIIIYVPVLSLGSIFVAVYQKNVDLYLSIDKS